MKDVPIWEKSNLTLEEAAAYSGIGINKLRSLSDNEHCQFVLWVGSKRLIKQAKMTAGRGFFCYILQEKRKRKPLHSRA